MNLAPNKGAGYSLAAQEKARQALERTIAIYGKGDHTTQGFFPSNRRKRVFGSKRGFPWGSLYSFGLGQPAGNTARVYPGTLWIHGVGSYTTAQTDVTLSSSPDAYIYLSHAKDHTSNSIPSPAIATSPVAVAPSDYQFLLYKFTVVSGSNYKLSRVYHGGHDIHIGGILR